MNKTARVAATERPGREGNLDASGLCLCQTLFSGRSPRALIHSFNNKKKEKKPNQTRLKLLENLMGENGMWEKLKSWL